MDSWDQAPAASTLEALLTRALAAEYYDTPHPDALVTTGGTEANQLALLLARERHGPRLTVVHGASAHHSVPRSAWLLGLPPPSPCPPPPASSTPPASPKPSPASTDPSSSPPPPAPPTRDSSTPWSPSPTSAATTAPTSTSTRRTEASSG